MKKLKIRLALWSQSLLRRTTQKLCRTIQLLTIALQLLSGIAKLWTLEGKYGKLKNYYPSMSGFAKFLSPKNINISKLDINHWSYVVPINNSNIWKLHLCWLARHSFAEWRNLLSPVILLNKFKFQTWLPKIGSCVEWITIASILWSHVWRRKAPEREGQIVDCCTTGWSPSNTNIPKQQIKEL